MRYNGPTPDSELDRVFAELNSELDLESERDRAVRELFEAEAEARYGEYSNVESADMMEWAFQWIATGKPPVPGEILLVDVVP